MEQKKLEYAKDLQINYPDLLVMYLDKANNTSWDKEQAISTLSDEKIQQFNLRKQTSEEVILDIEEPLKLDEIKRLIKDRDWSYEIWATGSRGYHIKIKFDNLSALSLDLRNRVRKYLISSFDTDTSLSSEAHFLACEYSKHFKTGNYKTLFETIGNKFNSLPNDIINYCKQDLEHYQNINNNLDYKPQVNFENYLEDPYLKYILSNNIVDGERNSVLFKNIALGLVKAGLKPEDIFKIGKKIVDNCPGKHINEFMGWVNKAIKGDIKDYNKHELVNWSAKYNHPILYDLISEIDERELMGIKTLWDIIWNHRIAVQPIWKDLCFYNMISTILKEKDEDYRLHIIFSSYSRSGKDEGINLIKEILDRLNFKTHKPSEITDRTLIGGINQSAIDFNTKYGLDENTLVNKGKRYKEPKEEGILATADWMAFGESESVFKPGTYNKGIQRIFRQAMDKSRFIEKGVSGHIIPFYSNTVFVFTTYSMPKTVYELLNNGLFQRTLYYNKELTHDDHIQIRKHIVRNKFGKNNDKYDEKIYMALLIKLLKELKIWYNENKKFTFFKDSDEYINTFIWDKYEAKYSALPSEDKNIMDSMVRNAAINLDKISILKAISERRSDIYKDDIDSSFKILEHCIESIKFLIMNQNPEKKRLVSLMMLLKDGSKNASVVYEELEYKLGIKSSRTKNALLQKAKALDYINKFDSGRFTMYNITEKGLDFLGDL